MEVVLIMLIPFGFLAFVLWLDYLGDRHRCECDSRRNDLEDGDL